VEYTSHDYDYKRLINYNILVGTKQKIKIYRSTKMFMGTVDDDACYNNFLKNIGFLFLVIEYFTTAVYYNILSTHWSSSIIFIW